jgi:citrate synthase
MNSIGLEHVVAGETMLSFVDGQQGVLVYRGHWADELAQTHTFEEVAELLWTGKLPDAGQRGTVNPLFLSGRIIPDDVLKVIDHIPVHQDMMSFLGTAISVLSDSRSWPPTLDQAVRITALVPSLIAYRYHKQQQGAIVPPDPSLSHTENYLYMLQGEKPLPSHVQALQAYFILTMEHSMNASTFAGRVVTSTQSDMAAALTACLAAMKGPLHGGAPSAVMDMLEQIKSPERVEPWLRETLTAGHRLMGFGHRVYKTRDPRATALRSIVEKERSSDPWFALATHVEDTAIKLLEEVKPGRHLYPNVEYWAAAILSTVGVPKELYTATFTLARMVGWTAHIMEQAAHNRLIRPSAKYVGEMPKTGV